MISKNKYNHHGFRISKNNHSFIADMSGETEVKYKTTGKLLEVEGFDGLIFIIVGKNEMPEGAAGHCVFEFTTGLGITNPCGSRKFIEDEVVLAIRILNQYGRVELDKHIGVANKINEVLDVIEWQL
jgi:hypothetical protein